MSKLYILLVLVFIYSEPLFSSLMIQMSAYAFQTVFKAFVNANSLMMATNVSLRFSADLKLE